MKNERNIVLGVDVGGSHITASAVDLDELSLVEDTQVRSIIDHRNTKEVVLEDWTQTIRRSLQVSGVEDGHNQLKGIAFAMPGPFDYPQGVGYYQGNDKYECLYNVDVRGELSERLELPGEYLHFFNDASSFAMGAALAQEVADRRSVCITLGTGFGAAFIKDGVPMMEDPSIPENGCLWDKDFEGGIADDYFSTRWFVGKFRELTGKTCSGVKEILSLQHQATGRVFEEFTGNLSQFLEPYLERFQAEVLLIGGNIAQAHEYFLECLQTNLGNPLKMEIRIVEDTEGWNMLGCAHLMQMNYWKHQPTPKSFF